MGKDFKIWGISYGLIGDLIMALPSLTYYEKKYPNSYKIWVIEKKCSQCASLFLNHPLDRKSTRLNSSHLKLSRMPSSA